MSAPNLFHTVNGFKKEDLKSVVERLDLVLPRRITILELMDLILNSADYNRNPEFVRGILASTVEKRKKLGPRWREREERERLIELGNQRFEDVESFMERMEFDMEFIDWDEASYPRRNYNLLELQFKQLGDLEDWVPFWSLFQHIDEDEDLGAEEKFQYLIQATIVGSRAREVVESFQPTGRNYKRAVKSLKSCFNKHAHLIEFYDTELLKVIISVKEGNCSLTSLYNKLQPIIQAFENLGVTSSWRHFKNLYHMVESCFSEDFLKAWNGRRNFLTPNQMKECLSSLMSFLKSEMKAEGKHLLAKEALV